MQKGSSLRGGPCAGKHGMKGKGPRVTEVIEGRTIKIQSQSQPLNAAEILAKGREPRKFLVTQKARPASGDRDLGVIPINSYTLLVAESGHGKTWISLELARLMATPRAQRPELSDWLGMYDVEPCRVLYLDEENGEPLLGERLGCLGLKDTADLIVWSRCGLKVDISTSLDRMISYCLETKRQVVFLDSLVRFHRREENDAQAMAEVAAAIRTLVAHNLTVIALHHTRKGNMRNVRDEDKQRGSSEIMAGADTVLFLENMSKNRNVFELSATKLRYASREAFRAHNFCREEQEGHFWFVHIGDVKQKTKDVVLPAADLGEGGLGADKPPDPVMEKVFQKVCQLIAAGLEPNVIAIRDGLRLQNKRVSDALLKLRGDGPNGKKDQRLDMRREGSKRVYHTIDKPK